MSLFFNSDPEPVTAQTPNMTLTLERALGNAFVNALQAEMGSALVVTHAENFDKINLPACFVRVTREEESIVNSAIFRCTVDVSLLVQADDANSDIQESLWSEILCVTHDIFGLRDKLNAVRPQYAYICGILRDGAVTQATNERHFERSVSITVHAALVS